MYTQSLLLEIPEPPDPIELARATSGASLQRDIVSVGLEFIEYNPYQTRDADDDEIETLANNIERDGLLHPPTARPHPTVRGIYQIAQGHRRYAAYQYLHNRWRTENPNLPSPWDVMPLDVRALSNLQMWRVCIGENDQRRPLTAIEKAQALHRAIKEFGLTQQQAGDEFRLSQSAVSNLLSLLRLPAEAQRVVSGGVVPERHARAVVGLSAIAPEVATAVLHRVAESADGEKDATLEREMFKALEKNGVLLRGEMPAITPDELLAEKAAPFLTADGDLPPCDGCKFKTMLKGNTFCTRPACYEAKAHSDIIRGVRATAENKGVEFRPAADADLVSLDSLCQSHEWPDWAARILKNKRARALVVIVPDLPTKDARYNPFSWSRRQLFGNEHAALYTTHQEKLLKLEPVDDPTEAAEEAREKAEQQAELALRQVAADENHRLLELAVDVLAPKFFANPTFVEIVWNTLDKWVDMADEIAPELGDEDDGEEPLTNTQQGRVLARFMLNTRLFDATTDAEAGARYPFCAADLTARTLYETLQGFGLHVPPQIALAADIEYEAPKPAKPAKKAKK